MNHDAETIAGIPTRDFGSLAYRLALIVAIGSAVLVMFRERLTQALSAALIWIVIGLTLAVGYTYRFDLRDISERVLAELVPGRVVQRAALTVEIVRGSAGDFQ